MENTFLYFKKVTSARDDQQLQLQQQHLFLGTVEVPATLVSTLRSEFKSRWEFIILFMLLSSSHWIVSDALLSFLLAFI